MQNGLWRKEQREGDQLARLEMGGEGQLAIRGDGGGGEEGQIQEAGLSGEKPVADDK